MTKDRNRNNLKHETKEWKKYRSYSLVTNAGWKGGEERKTLTFLSRTRTLGHRFYDLKFSRIAIDFSLMSHEVQWIHKESSCIVLRSSMSKVSCIKIHSERKEISSSFVTKKKKSFLTNDRKRINPFRQIRLNDKLDINADMLINITGLEEAYLSSHEELWSCSISDSSIICVTCLYELLHNYLWPLLLHPNSAVNSQRDRELRPQNSLPTER